MASIALEDNVNKAVEFMKANKGVDDNHTVMNFINEVCKPETTVTSSMTINLEKFVLNEHKVGYYLRKWDFKKYKK